jgi:hypothetical protein
MNEGSSKLAKITIEVELTTRQMQEIRLCSLERVINTSTRLLSQVLFRTEGNQEDQQVNLEDWDLCKIIATDLWNAARNAILAQKS